MRRTRRLRWYSRRSRDRFERVWSPGSVRVYHGSTACPRFGRVPVRDLASWNVDVGLRNHRMLCPNAFGRRENARETEKRARESLPTAWRWQEERHRIPLMNLRRAPCPVHVKAQGRVSVEKERALRVSGQIDHGEFGEDPGGERSPGEQRAVIGGNVGCGNGLGDGEKPWDRGASFVKRSNGERARAAVTRYGCSRGESSEGCEARSRGGLRSFVSPRGGPGGGARNGPNPMIGCRAQQTCDGRAE
jgi:hypothetical protein